MLNIAVVDDEERIRLGLGKLIRDAGEQYRVVGTFASGQELLDQWHELQPDLVITDIKMPQMNGLQLMANIKQMACRTKFAVLSGYNDFEYARTAMRQGALEYLLKPVNMKELLRMLENVDELVKGEQNERKLESDDLVSFLLGTDQRTMPEHLFEEVCDRLDQQALFHGHYAVLLLRTFPEIAEERLLAWTSVWGRSGESSAAKEEGRRSWRPSPSPAMRIWRENGRPCCSSSFPRALRRSWASAAYSAEAAGSRRPIGKPRASWSRLGTAMNGATAEAKA